MKHRGSISQTYLKRDNEVIPELYRRAKAMAEYPTTTMRIFEIAASLPVDMFYIADDAAMSYIRTRIYDKKHPTFLSPYKQKLFDALYELVTEMMAQPYYQNLGLTSTVIIALTKPAPCVGLTPGWMYVSFRRWCKSNKKKTKP